MKTWLSPTLALGISALLCLPLQAQNATTDPVGVLQYTIPANSTRTISFPLNDTVDPSFQGLSIGTISGSTANTITVTGANWAPGALSNPAAPYFIRILSGPSTGRLLQISTAAANTSETATVLNEGTDLTTVSITAGTRFKIIPADTLLSLFGSNVHGGTSADVADNVQRWTGTSWQTFYYNTANNRWQASTSTASANNVVLRPDVGYAFVRRGSSPFQFSVTGEVPSTDILVATRNSGFTFIANPFPTTPTLLSITNSITGWASGSDSSSADIISRWTGTSWQNFYKSPDGNLRLTTTNAIANSVTIAANQPISIQRRGSTAGTTQNLVVKPF